MTPVPVVHNAGFMLGVFLANGIGCVLAVFCLVRMADKRRSTGNRALLVFAAAWAVIETARDDALFVVATAVHLRDDQVRFVLLPGFGLTVVAMLIAVAAFGVAATWPRPVWTVTAGVTVGLLTAAMIVDSCLAGHTGFAESVDAPRAAAIAVGLAAVFGAAVRLATGATERWAMASTILGLAATLTAGQYLMAGQVTVDTTTATATDTGVDSIRLLLFTTIAFGIRTILLTLMSLADDDRGDRPGRPGGRADPRDRLDPGRPGERWSLALSR